MKNTAFTSFEILIKLSLSYDNYIDKAFHLGTLRGMLEELYNNNKISELDYKYLVSMVTLYKGQLRKCQEEECINVG